MFKIVESLVQSTESFEKKYMTDSEDAIRGAVYIESSGRMTLATGTDNPTHLCEKSVAGGTDVESIFTRLRETDILETTSTATVAATLLGAVVTIHTDGLTVTATTTSGVFMIHETDGATTNSTVRGSFLY